MRKYVFPVGSFVLAAAFLGLTGAIAHGQDQGVLTPE